jgi:DNA-binding transcriptional ArsR family regulator
MTESQALLAFAALAQDTRLSIVRRLVKAGADGMSAGEIAEAAGASPSNVSFHLKELERAGLIASRRLARSIIYSADYAALRALIRFLMEDCCSARAEICAPIYAEPCCGPRAGTTSAKASLKRSGAKV